LIFPDPTGKQDEMRWDEEIAAMWHQVDHGLQLLAFIPCASTTFLMTIVKTPKFVMYNLGQRSASQLGAKPPEAVLSNRIIASGVEVGEFVYPG
jgi:hypothetical protein